MIVSGGNNVIERGGDVPENQFKIKATGKAFKILSDGLYSDKPLAIVRELSCNAYDSHIAAGKADVPFDIHLPSSLEPWFSVRDYGVGLSLEGVTEIFTTYFESTKSESNDFVGAFGLGSKSPFSYVDSFTITSRHNGRRYSFAAFISENEMPAIALLGEDDTDEGNGVEITIPVRSEDFGTFKDKTDRVIRWFDVKPNILGVFVGDSFGKSPEMAVTGTGWSLMVSQLNSGYHHSHRAVVVQGNVSYPVDPSALQDFEMTDFCRQSLRSPLVMYFNIGELEVAASREQLSYKADTVKAITERLELVSREFMNQFEDCLSDCETAWQAGIKAREITQTTPLLHTYLRDAKRFLMWRGVPIDHRAGVSVMRGDYPSLRITRYSHKVHRDFDDGQFTVSPARDITIYVDDLKRGGVARFNLFHKTKVGPISFKYLVRGDEHEVTKFIEAIGSPEVKYTSSLPEIVRQKVPKRTVFKINIDDYASTQTHVDPDEFDFDDGGFYYALNRGKPVDDRGLQRTGHFDMIYLAVNLGILSNDEASRIRGFAPPLMKQVKASADWKDLYAELRVRMAKYVADKKLSDQIATKNAYNQWYAATDYQHCSLMGFMLAFLRLDLPKGHEVREMLDTFQAATNIQVDNSVRLCGYLDLKIQGGVTTYDFSLAWLKLIAKYPMLVFCTHESSLAKRDAIANYIKLVDLVDSAKLTINQMVVDNPTN